MLTNRGLATTIDRMMSLNRALDDVLSERSNGAEPFWVPAFDMAERPDGYVIFAELPGVDPDGVELSLEKNVLTIRFRPPDERPQVPWCIEDEDGALEPQSLSEDGHDLGQRALHETEEFDRALTSLIRSRSLACRHSLAMP